MQYVADPGDFRNLAKNIQISNLQSPLFIAWLHAKEQYSYTLYIFYRSCDFDISISFSFFFSYYKFFVYACHFVRESAWPRYAAN